MRDKWFYRGVVMVLGFSMLGSLGGYIYLAAIGADTPQALVAIGSAAGGALAGLFK